MQNAAELPQFTRKFYSHASLSTAASHKSAQPSVGICQPPRGDKVTEPTMGPSGIQERLNCWEKKRR